MKKCGLESVIQDKDVGVSDRDKEMMPTILEGRAMGRNVVHVWNDKGTLRTANGKMEKLKGNKKYKAAY